MYLQLIKSFFFFSLFLITITLNAQTTETKASEKKIDKSTKEQSKYKGPISKLVVSYKENKVPIGSSEKIITAIKNLSGVIDCSISDKTFEVIVLSEFKKNEQLFPQCKEIISQNGLIVSGRTETQIK